MAGEALMLTEIAGIRVGHWTDPVARTGCTVVLFPEGATASAEVRGGAPAGRELDLLAPERTVRRIDAAVLTGGSAFGLAAADGVMRFCEERDMGVPTPAGRVPIVPALGLYDLAVGDPKVRPRADDGYAACLAATAGPVALGPVGAGAGTLVGMYAGPAAARPGALAGAVLRAGDLAVAVLAAVNAFGAVDLDGSGVAEAAAALAAGRPLGTAGAFTNTTIGVVATNARLDKLGCFLVAQGAHDGLARALAPPHTRVDGDAVIAAATGQVDADVDAVRLLAVAATERAIRSVAGGDAPGGGGRDAFEAGPDPR
jgi:L-aminopeptidase/D-esterase-like protein